MIEKGHILHALYSMIDSPINETRILAARTTRYCRSTTCPDRSYLPTLSPPLPPLLFSPLPLSTPLLCLPSPCAPPPHPPSPPLSNLLFSADTREVAIEEGALFTLQAGIISGNADASRHCLKALFSACKNVPLMPIIAKTSLPIALCTFAAGEGWWGGVSVGLGLGLGVHDRDTP